MSYEWFANRYPMRAYCGFNAGSGYEMVLGTAPTVVGSPMMTGAALRGKTGNNVNYGSANYNITDTTRPLTFVGVWTPLVSQNTSATTAYVSKYDNVTGWLFGYRAGRQGRLYLQSAGGILDVAATTTAVIAAQKYIVLVSYNGGLRGAGVSFTVNGVPVGSSIIVDTLTAASVANAATMSTFPSAAMSDLQMFAWIDAALTPSQMNDVYEMLASERPARSRSYRRIVAPYPGRTPAEYAANGPLYDTDMSTVNGKLVDLTPGNRVGTPSGTIDTVAGPFGSQAKEFWGGRYTLPAADPTMFRTNDWSVSCWVRSRDNSFGYILMIPTGSHYVAKDTPNNFRVSTTDSSNVQRLTQSSSNTCPVGQLTHFVGTRKLVNGTDLQETIIVNGLVVAQNTFAGVGVAIPAPSQPVVGATNTGTSQLHAAVAQLRYRTTAMTAAEARAEYVAGDRTILDARLERTGATPVTPVAVTGAGQEIKGTPWTTGAAGNWKLIEAAPVNGVLGKRTISYSSSGDFIYAADTEAFGAWYFDVVFTTTADTYVNLVADKAAATVAPLGYAVRFSSSGQVEMVRTTGVGAAQLFFTAAGYLTNGVTYSCMVTRTVLGQFALWIKGGVYAEYTLMAPAGGANPTAVDLTYTTSKYAVWNRNGGTGALGDFLHRSCALTPQEAQAKGLITGVPVFTQIAGDFTTTKLAQSWTLKFTSGTQFYVDWGDGFVVPYIGTGADQVITHTYAGAGTYTVRWYTTTLANLQTFNGSGNVLSGTIPSFAAATGLVTLRLDNNAFSGYTSGAIALTCTTWRADINALPQASVDQILADFLVGAAGRPGVGTINLSGGTNAAPSAAGLASKAAFLALQPGWTISNN